MEIAREMLSRDLNRAELDEGWHVGVIGDLSLQEGRVLLKGWQEVFNRLKRVMAHGNNR
jgi:hypothetical protein